MLVKMAEMRCVILDPWWYNAVLAVAGVPGVAVQGAAVEVHNPCYLALGSVSEFERR